MGLFRKKRDVESKSETGLIQLNNQLTDSFSNVQKDTANIMKWLSYFYHKNQQQEELLRTLSTKNSKQENLIEDLQDQNSKNERELKNLKQELEYMPKTKEDIRKIVDEFYSYKPILTRLNDIDTRFENLKKSHIGLHDSHHELSQKHSEIEPKIDALKSEIKAELSTKTAPKTEILEPITSNSHIENLNKRLEKLETRKATIKEKIIKRIAKKSKDYIKSIVLSYIRKYNEITALQLKEMIVEEQALCSKSSFYRLLEEIEQEPDIGFVKKGKEKHYMAKVSKKNY
jgi:chromosome segregation ATPase